MHVVCHSGGHSSALAGIEVVNRFGRENTVLLNHDMHFTVEHADIKRFKREVAAYVGVPITYANRNNAQQDQFDVCVEAGGFKFENGYEICTARLKTEPFMAWLKANANPADTVIYYGFDATEQKRIQRRVGIMGAQGWKTDYPMIWKDRTVLRTSDIGIERPSTYSVFTHGNCIGCLKAGWQHWYIVYCTRPDIWLKAKWAEDEIGYAIHHDENGPVFLEDMEPKFEAMKSAGIPATEHIPHQRFWAQAKKIINISVQQPVLPCECTEAA